MCLRQQHWGGGGGIQQLLELVVVHVIGQWAAQSGLLKTKKIFADRASGDVAAFGNFTVAELTIKF